MKKLKHKTILLIEKDDSESVKIKDWINTVNTNTTIYSVKDCRLGLDLLNGNAPDRRKIMPDIILVNIYAPVMDGLEFLEIIRSYLSFRAVKVYFLVPGMEGDNSAVSSQFQIEGMLSKPFDLNFQGKETVSIRKLNAELTGSANLKLFSFMIIPDFLNLMLEGIKKNISGIINTVRHTRHITLLKTTAFVTTLLGMVIITAAKSYVSHYKKSQASSAISPAPFIRNTAGASKMATLIPTELSILPVNKKKSKIQPIGERQVTTSLIIPADNQKPGKKKTLKIVVLEDSSDACQSEAVY